MELQADLRKALLCEHWELRIKQAVLFAHGKINALRWKRGYTGPLPDGHDENGVASEAIKQLFEGNCRIKSFPYTAQQLDNEIMRLISNLAHALLRRKETRIVRSEHDLEQACEEHDRDCELHRVKGDVPDASDEELFGFVKRCKSVSGAVTLNLPIGQDGVIPERSIEQMRRLGQALGGAKR